MQKNQNAWIKRGSGGALAIALAGLLVWALLPQAVPVDIGNVERSTLRVTVEEEGKTQIRDVFVVAAPISGTVLRPPVRVGDAVVKDETVVAAIRPPAPAIRDIRTSLELETQVKACEANVKLADAELRQAHAELKFAETEFERTQTLARKGIAAERALQKSEADLEMRRASVTRAEAAVMLRKRELESARVRQLGPEDPAVRTATSSACSMDVKSPENGRVLKIVAESEQTLNIGAPLLEIGNPSNLEIVVELLSADAVKIKTGASATVEGWGGAPLRAHITRIDPSGFTKVSALGIEEQRVKTILALDSPINEWVRLGHDFRVFVKIDVFEAKDALVVPLGALFRRGADWCLFVVKDGRAHMRVVEIGQRNTSAAEVVSGIAEGEEFVLHPSDRVSDAVRVQKRNSEN